MKFRCVTLLKAGGRIELEVEDSDLTEEERELPAAKKYKALSAKADIFSLDYLRTHAEISDEFFAQRVREIKGDS